MKIIKTTALVLLTSWAIPAGSLFAIQNPSKTKHVQTAATALDANPTVPAPERQDREGIHLSALGGYSPSPSWGDQILSYFKSHPEILGLSRTPDLRVDYVKRIPGTNGLSDRVYVNMVQTINGVDVEGTSLSFDLNPTLKAPNLDDVHVRLYPTVVSADPSLADTALAKSRIQQRSGSTHLRQMNRKVRWVQGRWRTLHEFAIQDKGLHGAVDGSGNTYVWDDRVYASYTGTVTGRQTNFDPAATGNNLNEVPLRQLKIADGLGTTAFTDDAGAYSFITPSNGDVLVGLVGKWSDVNDMTGGDLSVRILAGSVNPVNLLFNPSGNVETNTAQVNAYRHATVIHDWLAYRGVEPSGIDIPIPTNVNVNDTCNAYYDGVSLNFFKSGNGCLNSAYDTVVYHEYGHFVDHKIGGITEGGLSEGWGDVMATYITGQPLVGEGFFGPGSAIRNANNNYVYVSSDEVHTKGQAWMGFAWDLRTNLINSLGPTVGVAFAENLVIPTLWANSPDIPSAVRAVALRDDDDGNLSNGTPNFTAIQAAAAHHGLAFVFDTSTPTVAITAPAAGTVIVNLATVLGTASDDMGLSKVVILVDGTQIGIATGLTSWSYTLDTWNITNGTHTLTARAIDLAGNQASIDRPVTVQNTGAATYNSTLHAPQCTGVISTCNSATLLNGRGFMTSGQEPHQPNTLVGSPCADGSAGTYHTDESVDSVRVFTPDNTPFAAGKTVRVEATVWAFSSYTTDALDLYYASDANSPTWTLLATLPATKGGSQVLGTNFVLPSGAQYRAIRANFRYGYLPSVCSTGDFDDHDDLVFQVGVTTDTTPPTAPTNIAFSNPTPTTLQLAWTNSTDNFAVTGYRVDVSTSNTFGVLLPTYTNTDLGNVTGVQLSGLSPATTYYARVRAYDAAQNISPNSAAAQGVTSPMAGLPDLTITQFSITPAIVAPNTPYQINITVRNQGSGPASNPVVLQVSKDITGVVSWSGLTPSIAAGQDVNFTFNGTPTAAEASRHYVLHAFVGSASAETDTTNNDRFDYLTVTTGNTTETFLSNLIWISTSSTIPPGRDTAAGGGPMLLNPYIYTKGLGVRANTDIVFPIPTNQQCSFNTLLGMDDNGGLTGAADIWALTDNTTAYFVGAIVKSSGTQSIALDVTGHNRLTLRVTDHNDGTASDYVDWALARLHCNIVPDTTPPVISFVTVPMIGTSSAAFQWNTDELSSTQIDFGVTSNYGYSASDYQAAMVHQIRITELQPATTYHYKVSSTDPFNNKRSSTDFTFMTASLPDVSSPTVSITAPTPGSLVSGSVPVLASVSDNVGVTKVEFYLDGLLQATVTTVPYQFNWDTTLVTPGLHTLSLKAYDAANNVGISAPVTVTVAGPANKATFIKQDSTTQGTWKGVYGADGYAINSDVTSYPSYAQVSFNGAASYVWAYGTTDPRAPQKGLGSDRIASTWYTGTSYTIDLNLTDGATHQVALYALDWDNYGPRVEAIEIRDPSGTLLDSQTLTNFGGGKYAVWSIKGHVIATVKNQGSVNAVLSGIFFGGTGTGGGTDSTPPTVTINSPLNGSTVSGLTTVSGTASDNVGVTKVEFYLDNLLQATATAAPYQFNWNTTLVSAGAHTLSAKAYDAANNIGLSAPVTVTVSNGGGTANQASFIKLDSTTQGTWKGVYGLDGYAINSDVTSYPSYAQVSFAGAGSYIWAIGTTDVRALQKGIGSDRIASTWYTPTSYTIDLNLTDGTTHQVALYAVDWDGYGPRAEAIEIRDPSGTMLDSQSLTSFTGGKYGVWSLKGHVIITVRNQSSGNAVLSGIFFGGTGTGGGADTTPPTVTINSPVTGTTVSGLVTVSATASDNIGVTKVEFYRDNLLQATVLSAPFQYTWDTTLISSSGPYTLTAKAYDAANNVGISAPVTVLVFNGGGTANQATFIKQDTITQGTWKGVYGTDGYAINSDVTAYPSYAQVSFNGAANYVWNSGTTDPRALQKGAGSDRIASTWYTGTNYTIDLNLTDGAAHQIAIYAVDWDAYGPRSEVIEIRDPSGTLLDSQSLTNFVGGKYVVWTVKGHVVIKLINQTTGNAVLSGIFFGGTGSVSGAGATVAAVSGAHAHVYPNPWRAPRDTGSRITFDQMNANSTVKIFTISGHWVTTLAAPSGIASWDIKNTSGDLVASGIYLYLVTDTEGHKTRGKLAIIR